MWIELISDDSHHASHTPQARQGARTPLPFSVKIVGMATVFPFRRRRCAATDSSSEFQFHSLPSPSVCEASKAQPESTGKSQMTQTLLYCTLPSTFPLPFQWHEKIAWINWVEGTRFLNHLTRFTGHRFLTPIEHKELALWSDVIGANPSQFPLFSASHEK